MKKLMTIAVITATAALTSCSTYDVEYDVSLSAIERVEILETTNKVERKELATSSDKNLYEDDFIKTNWIYSKTIFNFEMENKTDRTITINWDAAAYVDAEGRAGKISHSGVKYMDMEKSQVISVIPNKSYITNSIYPIDNVYYDADYNNAIKRLKNKVGWQHLPIIPSKYKSAEQRKKWAPYYVGKNIRFVLPLTINDKLYEYSFYFRINNYKAFKDMEN